jgi:hypothetical protein
MNFSVVKVQSIRIPAPQMWVIHFGKTMDVTLVTVSPDQGMVLFSRGTPRHWILISYASPIFSF